MRSRIKSYGKTPSSFKYDIWHGDASTPALRELIASISAHGKVSSIPKRSPIRLFDMARSYCIWSNLPPRHVPRVRQMVERIARTGYGVPLVREVWAAGDALPDVERQVLRERGLPSHGL